MNCPFHIYIHLYFISPDFPSNARDLFLTGGLKNGDGDWVWGVNGSPYDYDGWAGREPDNLRKPATSLVLYNPGNGFGIGDDSPDIPKFFICELDL